MEYLTVSEAIEHAVLTQYREEKLSLEEACLRLSIHRTTLWRKLERLKTEGPLGLAHKLRGKPSNFAHDLGIRQSILKLYEQGYKPFGFRVAHFYQEALEDKTGSPSYPTVLRWLKGSGLVEKSRRGVKHHSRRPRREAFGEMIQMDTSIHDWLDWGKNIALISNMDDCTNVLCGAYLTHGDTTLGNMTVLRQTLTTYGLFASLYVDRSPIFKVTRTGGMGRIRQPTFQAAYITQVKRALDELGIELIYAYSPQAKGRIERSYGTWQSRLIPELRKNGIREIEKANDYIRKIFIPKHNDRFASDPKRFPMAFVPIKGINLDYILAEKYRLTVSNDHIVSSKEAGLSLKILPSQHRLSYAKAKVDVFKHTNGRISVLYKGEPLNFKNYAH
jgi:hypothetical protein